MGQRINHLYKLIALPAFYETVQSLLGRRKTRDYLCRGPLKTKPGDRVLDVGCGPATLRPYLGDVEYLGMDLNPAHIEKAKEQYGHLGSFMCGDAVQDIEKAPGPYDFIICIGLLHHLDDDEASHLINSLAARLSEKGRLVTYDPVYVRNQNFIAKKLNDLDAGKNIRTKEGYVSLFDSKQLSLKTDILNNMLNVPYNHCCNILERCSARV